MYQRREGGVLVGTDGSKASLKAVEWGAHCAAQTGRDLTVCCVLPGRDHHEHADLTEMSEGLRSHGEKIVARAASRARHGEPALPVSRILRMGHPAAELRDLAADQALLVVGSHGADWFEHLIIGSVSTQAVRHAPCTVVVTRPTVHPSGPVVVGVDGSPSNEAAVAFAFETAARCGSDLVAVHAFTAHAPLAIVGLPPWPELDATDRRSGEKLLDEIVGTWEEKYPEVHVRRDVIRGAATHVLVDATTAASLVVVGSRGRGGFAGLRLGSVGQHVLAVASCSVAVAR